MALEQSCALKISNKKINLKNFDHKFSLGQIIKKREECMKNINVVKQNQYKTLIPHKIISVSIRLIK